MSSRTLLSAWPTALAVALLGGTPALATTDAASAHWPAWRGPHRTGVAPDANPPVEWSEESNVRWKVDLPGTGTATPIIWGDRVFILSAIAVAGGVASPPEAGPGGRPGGPRGLGGGAASEAQQFVVLCYDRVTGRELWRKVVREQMPHAGHHQDHGYASASPVTDGEVLVVHFGSFGTYGLSLEGELLWETDLGDMQPRNSFGEGSSPALHGDRIFILWDHERDDFIAALDRRSGKELWRTPRDEPTGWSTPLVVEHQGQRQVIVNGTNRVRSYNATLSILAAREGTPHVSGERLDGLLGVYASPIAAAGRVYLLGRNGVASVLKAGPKLEILATNRLEDGFDASPAAAGDALFLRGRESLYCLADPENSSR